jgi:hypothetical protein
MFLLVERPRNTPVFALDRAFFWGLDGIIIAALALD